MTEAIQIQLKKGALELCVLALLARGCDNQIVATCFLIKRK